MTLRASSGRWGPDEPRGGSQVADEAPVLLGLRDRVLVIEHLAPNFGYRDGAMEQAARRRGAERYDEFRLYDRAFAIDPPAATFDFVGVRPFVQPPLSPLLEFEMFDRVGHKDVSTRHACFRQRTVEDSTRRPDERSPREILVVSRLLADEHQSRLHRSLAWNDLRCIAIKRTAGTRRLLAAELIERRDHGM